MVRVHEMTQKFGFKKDVERMMGYKDLWEYLREFVAFADANPKTFYPLTPYIKHDKKTRQYNLLAYAFYHENKDLLDAGTRSIKLADELPRLRAAYRSDYVEELI